MFIYTDVNLLRENIKPIKNNAEIFLQASKETVKKMNVDKPKYMNTECTKYHCHMLIHPNATMHNVVSLPLLWVKPFDCYGGIAVGQENVSIGTRKKTGGEWLSWEGDGPQVIHGGGDGGE